MERLREILQFNFSGENATKTYFGGRITQSQLIVSILVILAIIVFIKVLKGIVKKVVFIGLIAFLAVYFGLTTPSQLTNVARDISDYGLDYYKTYAAVSKNIKIDNKTLKIKLGNDWVDVKDIQSVVSSNDNFMTLVSDGVSYVVDDAKVIELINSFR